MAGTGASGAARAGPIRLGIAPIGWSNDDLPELGGEISLEQCLSEARAAGYSGVEKGGKFPMDPKALHAARPRHVATTIATRARRGASLIPGPARWATGPGRPSGGRAGRGRVWGPCP